MNDEIYIIPTYLVNDKVKEFTRNSIQAIKAHGKEILLISHYYIPIEFQEMVDYCIYDKRNVMLDGDYKGWLHRKHLDQGFEIKSQEFVKSNSTIACFYFNHALSYIKNLGKRIVRLVDYDNIWNDLSEFDNNYKLLTTTNYESVRFKYDNSNEYFANMWSVDLFKHDLTRYEVFETYLLETVAKVRRYEEWYPRYFMNSENVFWKFKSTVDKNNELALSSVIEPEWVCLAIGENSDEKLLYLVNPTDTPTEEYTIQIDSLEFKLSIDPHTYNSFPIEDGEKEVKVYKNNIEIRYYNLDTMNINHQRHMSTLIRYEQ